MRQRGMEQSEACAQAGAAAFNMKQRPWPPFEPLNSSLPYYSFICLKYLFKACAQAGAMAFNKLELRQHLLEDSHKILLFRFLCHRYLFTVLQIYFY